MMSLTFDERVLLVEMMKESITNHVQRMYSDVSPGLTELYMTNIEKKTKLLEKVLHHE